MLRKMNWEEIPDDIVKTIVTIFGEMLKPQCDTELIFAYFSLLSTNKQLHQYAQSLSLDWLQLINRNNILYKYFLRNIEWQRANETEILEEPIRMIKTLTWYDCSLSIIHRKLESFMDKHNMRKPRNRPFPPFVLKLIKVKSKRVADQFKSYRKEYESMREKKRILKKALDVYSKKIEERKPNCRWLLLIAAQYIQND